MSTASLHQAWSLSASTSATSANTHSYSTSAVGSVGPADFADYITGSSASAPPGVNAVFTNDYLANRAYAHFLAFLLQIVPPSQTRLYEAIRGKYNSIPAGLRAAKAAGEKLGITLPTVREIPADWHEEVAIDLENLPEFSHGSTPFKKLVKLISELPKAPEKYHWASVVAADVTTFEVWGEIMPETQGSAPTATNPDETVQSYVDHYSSPEWVGYSKAIKQEIIKIRERAEETGWREEEAKALATRYTGLLNDSFRPELK